MNESQRICAAVRAAGVPATDIYDLVNSKKSYRPAIPILIDSLRNGIAELSTKEGVIRALGAKEARGTDATEVLIDEFWKLPADDDIMRWTIGNTISIIAEDSDFDMISKIVSDPKNGKSREMFVLSLGRVSLQQAEDLLLELLNDDQVAAHALDVLGKKKSKKARDKVASLLRHPKALIRKEASKALRRIEMNPSANQ